MTDSIVQLQRSQTESAAEILSSAFNGDPLISYFLPEATLAKLKALQSLSTALIRYSQAYNQIYTTADQPKGVAIWLPPEDSTFQFSQLYRLLTSGLLTFPLDCRWGRLIQVIPLLIEELSQRQKLEPHWYLAMLGVGGSYQGQGIGGALLQPVLQQADQDGIACYLETSTEVAVRFYTRHGFEVLHTNSISTDIPYWTMKRQPNQRRG